MASAPRRWIPASPVELPLLYSLVSDVGLGRQPGTDEELALGL